MAVFAERTTMRTFLSLFTVIGFLDFQGALRAQEDAGFLPTEDPRWVIVKYREASGVVWNRGGLRDPSGAALELRRPDGSPFKVSRALEREQEMGPPSLYFTVECPDPASAKAALRSLRADPRVESAHVPMLPPPSPSSCGTPDFTGLERHLEVAEGPPGNPPPSRLRPMHDIPGGTGQGVRFVDVEYAWRLTHEDLPPSIQVLGPTPRTPSGLSAAVETNHGTASLGVVLAQHNGLGVDGIAPDVMPRVAGSYTDTSQPYEVNLARAIDRARDWLLAGDVLLIEAQMGGPRWTNPSSQAGLVPVEWQQVVFDAIQAATSKGVIVVEAAANGGEDLDDPIYQGKFDRTQRDSRALIVTAAHAFPVPPGQQAVYSDFGNRIDLFYWTYPLPSAGYGDLQAGASDNCDYTQSAFGASSGASALVAGGIASLQGVARALFGSPLSVTELGSLLVLTGRQDLGSGARVGVRPEFVQALDSLLWTRKAVDSATFGALRNASFEVLAGAGFSMPFGWLVTSGNAFDLIPVKSLGDLLPTHRTRMLFFEDPFPDASSVSCRAGLLVPQGAGSLSVDWCLLSTNYSADDSCQDEAAALWIVDPATQASWPLGTFPLCFPFSQAASYGAYTQSTGWQTSHSMDLSGFKGKCLELNARVTAHRGAAGSRNAALALDNIRFTAVAQPSLLSVSPSQGTICGGTYVTVTGDNFTASDTRVLVGGAALEDMAWIDAKRIAGVAPKGSSPGPVAVTVDSPRGTATLSAAFTYLDRPCGTPFLRGDCNDSGGLDLSDAVFSLSFLFQGGRASPCEKACDANDDGGHDISDGVYILDYLFRGARDLPAPFPACGIESTADPLPCAGAASCP